MVLGNLYSLRQKIIPQPIPLDLSFHPPSDPFLIMKKKPHQVESAIKKVFSDFRSRLHTSHNQGNDVHYEVKEEKNGYTVVIHRERGMNQNLHFKTKKELNAFLKSLK